MLFTEIFINWPSKSVEVTISGRVMVPQSVAQFPAPSSRPNLTDKYLALSQIFNLAPFVRSFVIQAI